MRRPTILDVAARAGVSKSTVARVMSGGKNVSPDVMERVRTASKVLGYHRNNLAVSMRSGRSGLLGIIVPDISNPFWAEVVRGAQDAAVSSRKSLMIFSSDWKREREIAHLHSLVQARVDGFALNTILDAGEPAEFEATGLPFLLLGTSGEVFPGQTSVGSDIADGVETGLDHLAEMGHRPPVLLVGSERKMARAKFVSAVRQYYVRKDVDPDVIEIEENSYTVEGGRRAMARVLAHHHDGHIAIFAANDLMALGAILEARDAGLSCPEEVSVLGFDGIPAGEFCWPPLTTIVKPAKTIGSEAMRLLIDRIDGDTVQHRRRLPCRLLERGSVKRMTAKERLVGIG